MMKRGSVRTEVHAGDGRIDGRDEKVGGNAGQKAGSCTHVVVEREGVKLQPGKEGMVGTTYV